MRLKVTALLLDLTFILVILSISVNLNCDISDLVPPAKTKPTFGSDIGSCVEMFLVLFIIKLISNLCIKDVEP